MNKSFLVWFVVFLMAIMRAPVVLTGQEQEVVSLPEGVKAVWDRGKAFHETTPTREQVSINGLWRWQPVFKNSGDSDDSLQSPQDFRPPQEQWGYFKVPGSWPGSYHYMQKDSQTVFAHPDWQKSNQTNVQQVWYQREIEIPPSWTNRRIFLHAEYVNSRAVVFLNDNKVGEILFPDGSLELTACKPGQKYLLSMQVTALPLKEVMALFNDTNAPKTGQGTVARKGLCGDVSLVSLPKGPFISNISVDTSVQNKNITVHADVDGLITLPPHKSYRLVCKIYKNEAIVHRFFKTFFLDRDEDGKFSNEFSEGDSKKISIKEEWFPDQLWDIHTPENQWDLTVELLALSNRADEREVMDITFSVRFGVRELSIEGRDIYLNGSRIWLSCIPLDNALIGPALANYEAAKESFHRLKNFGINFVYTHNYDGNPGSYITYREILRAADDVGMLVSFTQPHFGHYDWDAPDANENNGYTHLAKFLVRQAQNHPSVVFYSMSHNGTGYSEDMNPQMMDGIQEGRNQWSVRSVTRAKRAEAIVQQLDPSRIVYHHASGNLGPMHSSNFYPNWVPIQEMSDWFEYWSKQGVKPLFMCEYGTPFTWDWTMYRGWYKGVREFGSAPVPWEFCNAEWNAQFLGDQAYTLSEPEKVNLRWETKQYAAGKVWRRWDYPYQIGARDFKDQDPVFAQYIENNWRAFRLWGLSINSPWEHGRLWSLRPEANKAKINYPVDWENLQKPGFSPDFQDQRYERVDTAFNANDWEPSEGAQALIRNNRPLLAFIGGKKESPTSKDHHFQLHAGSLLVEKQVVIINNSREPVSVKIQMENTLPNNGKDNRNNFEKLVSNIPTGEKYCIPWDISFTSDDHPGTYSMNMKATFSTGEIQEDSFTYQLFSPLKKADGLSARMGLFDPLGETKELLDRLGYSNFSLLKTWEEAKQCDILFIGKKALTTDGQGPNLSGVRTGQKVVVFEQTAEVLEKRLGFRVAEYGLRQVFARVNNHPILTQLETVHLADWSGSATLLSDHLNYQKNDNVFNGAPTVSWCDITVPRLWRCGNRGAVASVLIEKPTQGDFLPLVDGGFSLQYSPLMEYKEGKGIVLFCQLDVSGRTERDPAADLIVRNMIEYIAQWKPKENKKAIYLGNDKGKTFYPHWKEAEKSDSWPENSVLILGPGCKDILQDKPLLKEKVNNWISRKKEMLVVGLNHEELSAMFPEMKIINAEHIGTQFDRFELDSRLAGIGPADVHNRNPKNFPLVQGGYLTNSVNNSPSNTLESNTSQKEEIIPVGDGILAMGGTNASMVFCAMAPWDYDWSNQYNLKRTFRKTAFLISRLQGNLGIAPTTPLLERFDEPLLGGGTEMSDSKTLPPRWSVGLYHDQPEEWDDPYRFFRW